MKAEFDTSKLSKEPSFTETSLRSVITEFGIILAANKNDQWRPLGSAVIIGPRLAMTAKHVFEDAWRNFEWKRIETKQSPQIIAGGFHLIAFQGLNEGEEGALWQVTRGWLCPHSDIAFLQLNPFSQSAITYTWHPLILSLAPPKVGTRLSGFGYHSQDIEITTKENKPGINWRASAATSVGEVIEVFPVQRDAGMLNFSCFRMNARFDSGMSGGPIFDNDGHLCGIVSSSWLPNEGEVGTDSYACTLWPSMGTLIDLDFADRPAVKLYPVLDLARDSIIKALDWQRIELILDEYGGVERVGWRTGIVSQK